MRHLRVSSRAQPVLWVGLGVAGTWLLAAGLIWILDPPFRFNDDMIIASIASGDYTGEPNPRTLNGGALFSILLANAYTTIGSVSWLLWVLEFLLVGSFVIGVSITILAFRRRAGCRCNATYLGVGLSTLFLGIFALFWVPAPTWTVAGFAPGMASMILAIYLLGKTESRRFVVPWAIAGTLTGVVGLIRSGPFSLAAFSLVSAVFWFGVLRRLSLRQNLALLAPIVISTVFNSIAETQLYASEAWAVGRRTSQMSATLVDTYLLGALIPIGLNEGWKGYEVGFAAARYFVPSEAFTIQSFNSFLEAANPYRIGLWAISPPSLEGFANSLNATRTGWLVALVGAFSALALLLISRAVSWSSMSHLVAGLVLGLGLIWFLGVIRNNPGHVALPLGFVSAIGSVGIVATACLRHLNRENLASIPSSTNLRGASSWVLVATTFLAVLLTSLLLAKPPYRLGDGWSEQTPKEKSWNSYQQTFESLQKDCAIVGVNLGLEAAPANGVTPPGQFPLVQLMWNSLTPLTDERLTHLGMNKWNDLFARDACTYFVGGTQYAEGMTEYARDRVGGTGEFVRVDVEVEGAPEVWQWQGG